MTSSNSQYTLVIPATAQGERLDKVLTLLLSAQSVDHSRARVQALIELGQVTLDQPAGIIPVKDPALKVRAGQIYTLVIPPLASSKVEAQAIALEIVFEDSHLLVINKAPGMTVHPAPGSPDQTLVNALLAHCGASLSGIGGVARPGIVHRIDKDTSGLLAVAKHDAAHHALSAQLADRTLKRTYLAVCRGVPKQTKGTITGNIGRHPKHRQKMAVVEKNGKHAVTNYTVLETFGAEAALVECRLETGRTHQIRVHMQHIGHPLAGDATYGGRKPSRRPELASFPRQALHAWKLGLIHPQTGEAMEFTAELPEDMRRLVVSLKMSA